MRRPLLPLCRAVHHDPGRAAARPDSWGCLRPPSRGRASCQSTLISTVRPRWPPPSAWCCHSRAYPLIQSIAQIRASSLGPRRSLMQSLNEASSRPIWIEATSAGLIATKPRRRRQRSARLRRCWRISAPVPRTGCSAASHVHGWPLTPPAWPDRQALRRRPCSVRASPMATAQPLRTSSLQQGSPPTRWSVRTRNFARWGSQQCVRLLVRTAWYLDYGGRDRLGEEPASSPFRRPAGLTAAVDRLTPPSTVAPESLGEVFPFPGGTLSLGFPCFEIAKGGEESTGCSFTPRHLARRWQTPPEIGGIRR